MLKTPLSLFITWKYDATVFQPEYFYLESFEDLCKILHM